MPGLRLTMTLHVQRARNGFRTTHRDMESKKQDMRSLTVISCSEVEDPNWRWFEKSLAEIGVRLVLMRAIPRNFLERGVKVVNLPRPRTALKAVWAAKRNKAQVIVTHGPGLAAWSGAFARILKTDVKIVGHYFNFPELPGFGFAKRRALAWMLSRVDRIVVLSAFERDVYSEAFSLPRDRFDVQLWGISPPTVHSPDKALEPGDYVCAIGGQLRDYVTLVEAARQLPHVRFVLVVRPDNVAGLELPTNVTVYLNFPFNKTMNIMKYSRFMVLPLSDAKTACGHVTLVAAMHLGLAFIVTDSAGIRDYVADGSNGVTVPPRSSARLAATVEGLWNDRDLCKSLGENGQRFAQARCSEEQVFLHLRALLNDFAREASGADAQARSAV
jgi:glycosyltransferase involved in cell wall biosynthesis